VCLCRRVALDEHFLGLPHTRRQRHTPPRTSVNARPRDLARAFKRPLVERSLIAARFDHGEDAAIETGSRRRADRVAVSEVNGVRDFDAAGTPGRTIGLPLRP